jgi:hypothetical protein
MRILEVSRVVMLSLVACLLAGSQPAVAQSSNGVLKNGFRPGDGEEVLAKLRHLDVPSWNHIGHDAQQFRHYGPMAQDFYAAFGHDAIGSVGTPTTITSTDVDGILLIAMKAIELRTEELRRENALLRAAIEELRAARVVHRALQLLP